MSSVSFNESSSLPVAVQTPENAILDRLSGIAEQYAGQMYDWATQVYDQTKTLTDQVINGYLDFASGAGQFAANQMNRYENVFQPMENQLIQDANTYASRTRVMDEMGRAEAESRQGSEAGRRNAEAQLEQFGVDPSAGRYRGLEEAANVQAGAAAAAAGTQARRATEDTGRQLRSQAIAVGQNYPAAAINSLNAGFQGLAGAVNSKLATANTGAALMALPKGYLDTAMGLKLPPVGQNSQSQGRSSSSQPGQSKNPKEDKPEKEPQQARPGQNPFGGAPGQGNTRTGQEPDNGPFRRDPNTPIGETFDFGQPGSGGIPDYAAGLSAGTYNPNNYGTIEQGALSTGYDTGQYLRDEFKWADKNGLPAADPQFDSGDWSGWGDSGGGNLNPSPWGSTADWGSDYEQGASGASTSDIASSYFNNGQQDYSSNLDTGNWDSYGGANYDYGSDGSSYGYDEGYDYARGGAVPGGRQRPRQPGVGGGAVPRGMSPSRGRVTDDVRATIPQTGGRAKLNVGEFVLPKDVVAWKGHEFFQKMIAQARRARVGAPAQASR